MRLHIHNSLFAAGMLVFVVLFGTDPMPAVADPPKSTFDTDRVLKQLSNPKEQVRKKAAETIENAGLQGYRFLKRIGTSPESKFKLTGQVSDHAVPMKSTVPISLTLKNTGSSGAWIRLRNSKPYILLSIEDVKHEIYPRFSLSTGPPEAEPDESTRQIYRWRGF